MSNSLYDKLINHARGGVYPMHMPGHKRCAMFMPHSLPFELDITEIRGFDDLHDSHGVLLDTAVLAAALYSSHEAFLLVNGSTAGILAAIGAHTRRGDTILADINCHRSVKNAAELFGLSLAYVSPEIDGTSGVPCSITPDMIMSAFRENPSVKTVIITSPSYEGVVSDIKAIAEVVHDAGGILLVDCAHGAHLGFSDYFPESPIRLGADVVVTSLHKTLPALTQCSLLHVCSERADIAVVKHMLSILQTSSPSYVLMASIDSCLRLLSTNADKLFHEYAENLRYFSSITQDLKHLSILQNSGSFYELDPGKIVIVAKNTSLSGVELSDLLYTQYEIELERSCADYAIAMTSICDSCDGFKRLADALNEIDGKV